MSTKPKNPYSVRHEEYLERAWKQDYHNAEVFFQDAAYYSGQNKGWNEGFRAGKENWFNLDSQNDCADWLFVFLSQLAEKVETEFGEYTEMAWVLRNMCYVLAAADFSINPPETEEKYVDGVWVQPFEYANEPH